MFPVCPQLTVLGTFALPFSVRKSRKFFCSLLCKSKLSASFFGSSLAFLHLVYSRIGLGHIHTGENLSYTFYGHLNKMTSV